jgi:glycosyltransferase involved in cell wall biosynthesis
MKKDLLITYNQLFHYRKSLFNSLSEYYNVTVLHSGKETVSQGDSYSEKILPIRKIGPLFLQKGIITEIRKKQYDVIVYLFDLRYILTILSFSFFSRKAKRILWGAWFTKNSLANKARIFLRKRADASILYTYKTKQDFIDKGLDEKRLFVANNTFDVGPRFRAYEYSDKSSLLFVGSFDKRKQNDILISAFENIVEKIPVDIKLVFIGDGPEYENTKSLVSGKKISARIQFLGRINETEQLKQHYKEAIISVSFGQAGLSVLQCFGFGVPFLTKKNAVTGGEITNIKNGLNGILCEDSITSLENSLIQICNNVDHAKELGKNAFQYYSDFCTMENMTQGFRDAIENTHLSKIDKRI